MTEEQVNALVELAKLQRTPEQVRAVEQLADLLPLEIGLVVHRALHSSPVVDRHTNRQLHPAHYTGRFGHGGG